MARPAPLKVPLDPLTADFERTVRAQLAQLARQVNLRVPVNAEGERLRAQVAAQIRTVESTLRAKVPVDPEGAAEFRRKLAAQVAGSAAEMGGAAIKAGATFGQLARSRDLLVPSPPSLVAQESGSLRL